MLRFGESEVRGEGVACVRPIPNPGRRNSTAATQRCAREIREKSFHPCRIAASYRWRLASSHSDDEVPR
ncbi:hypothetical protein LA76x_1252 [Lysobacter antibioticus]|uniref:Uncharacterized protein n=1 Tax=Lysobacter antibioticus TaxID=84531 RepID=A0A0S2F7G2_LYSAN|nr:hypothetical protein LA76x_1252 [Lysobacter antibioticus]